jgi:hypothetical protein
MLMLIHLAEIIQKFSSSSPPSPLAPNTTYKQANKAKQTSKQPSLGEVYVGFFHEVST